MSGKSIPDHRTLTFDTQAFARAWLTVATAGSEDEQRWTLYRSVSIELEDDGVRLSSMDGYRVLTTWVGTHNDMPGMGLDEVPSGESCILSDADWRLRDLLRYALKVVTAKDASQLPISVVFGPLPLEDGQLPGTEPSGAIFSFPADRPGESVAIRALDGGEWPDYRNVLRPKVEAAKRMGIAPWVLSKLGSIDKWWGGEGAGILRFEFAGPMGLVRIHAPGLFGWELEGGFMPALLADG
jgi:hypothetical protein